MYQTIGHAHPTIWQFIERIQKEEASARLKMAEIERGDTPKRKKVYQDLTERLENLVSDYEKFKERNDRMKFLEMVSYALKTVEIIDTDDVSLDEIGESQD